MNVPKLAKKLASAAEEHAMNSGELEHIVGDMEEALIACFQEVTAGQFLKIASSFTKITAFEGVVKSRQFKSILTKCKNADPTCKVIEL